MLAVIQFRVVTLPDRCYCRRNRAPICADVRVNTTAECPAATRDQVTVEPRFTNLIRSWWPFVTRNVRKPKLCVLSESYTATDALPLILRACRQPLLPACVFLTRDTVRHPLLFFGKFVCEPICSWWEAFVNQGSIVHCFTVAAQPEFESRDRRPQTKSGMILYHPV
jgi:hypothetical protein